MTRLKNFPTHFHGLSDSFQGIGLERDKDKIIILFLLSFAISLAFGLVFIFLNLNKLPSQIPLFYSRVWGEGQLAPKNYIFLPVIGAFIIGLGNFLVAYFFGKRTRLITYLLVATSAIISILGTITVFKIINLIS